MTAYPTWVCHDCGMKYAHKPISRIGMATYHSGTCGVCKKQTDVTEPADFGYPNFEIERKDLMTNMHIKTKKSRRKKNAKRMRPANASPEAIAQYERNLGRKWRGNQDGAHEDALSILCDRGYITDSMRDKGQEFAELFNTFYPIHAKAASIGDLPGKGSIGIPIENQDERLARKEARFRLHRTTLMAIQGAYSVVVDVAVKGEHPHFLSRLISLEDMERNWLIKERDMMLNGYEPTADKSIMKQNEMIMTKCQHKLDTVREWVSLDIDLEMMVLKDGLKSLING